MSADSPGFSSESNEPSEGKNPPAMNSEYGTGSENDPSMTQEEEWDAVEAAEAALAGTDARSSPDTAATRAEHLLDAQADDQRPVTSAELQAAVGAVEARYEAKLEAAGAEYQEKLEAHAARYEAKLEELQGEIASLKRQLQGNADEPAKNPLAGMFELLHARSEFHGEGVDLYTDGKHWRQADALTPEQRQDLEAGLGNLADAPSARDQGSDVIGERPDDEADLPPERKELLEADDRKKSLKSRLLDRIEDDEVIDDAQEQGASHAKAVEQVLAARPPTQAHQVQPDVPYAAPAPLQATAGDIVSLAFMLGVAAAEGGRRVHDALSQRKEGR